MVGGEDFEIRLATRDGACAIAAVHLVSHRETYLPLVGEAEYRPIDPAERVAQWQRALAGDDIVLVARAAGQVVGFAHAKGEKINTLYILPSWHRRGIGRALLKEVCDRLAARGIALARFAVLAVNGKAIRFYEAAGARATGHLLVEEHGTSYEDQLFEIPTAGARP